MPVVAAEGAAGQTQFHDVIEHAVAGINLDLAVVQQVIGSAQPGADFVAPAELHRGESLRIEGRLGFLVQPDPQIERETVAHLPTILEVECLRRLLVPPGVDHTVTDNKVSVLALAGPCFWPEVRQIRSDDPVARRAGSDGRITLGPVHLDKATVVGPQNVIRLRRPEVPCLERVGAGEVDEIRGIHVDALAFVCVVGCG